MDFNTLCVHGCSDRYDITGAVSVPIFQTATFAHPGVGQSTGYDYSRVQNPTREHLEKTVAKLEQGKEALAFSSGMAAIAAMMELFSPGDHVICSDDLYGGSHRLFHHINAKNGISFTLVNTSFSEKVKAAIRPETKAILVETPTNPMMQVTDLRKIADLAHANGLLLAVDNTFLTPYLQKPLTLGADLVIHSGTKYLGGHNDALAGFLVANDPEICDRLRFIYKNTGGCLSPFDSWLLIRGIKTLPLRMDRQQENAQKIALWLTQQKKIAKVFYPGLPDHPDYELSRKQTSGFGSMISFEVDNHRTAEQILNRVELIQFAESLGGVESLVTYPMLQTHAEIPVKEREEKGINERLLRLSVGVENAEDLIADLTNALQTD
ncbi:trans-sulfuration enzyme family protein [Clostridium minihomine]|uniref:trans-sulfuration enzyme family protein n=1 Tax=Clostridium minihomine TaxID=2045012 RepID=UPI000C75E9AA|nr:PLP-dependent aspartate aminotransferase family protein [Clostridium minihomine]